MAQRFKHGSHKKAGLQAVTSTPSSAPTMSSAPTPFTSGCIRVAAGSASTSSVGARPDGPAAAVRGSMLTLPQGRRQPHERRRQAGLCREPTGVGPTADQQSQLHGATWSCGKPSFGGYAYSAPRPATDAAQMPPALDARVAIAVLMAGSVSPHVAGVQPVQCLAPYTSLVPCRGFYGVCWHCYRVCIRVHLLAYSRRL